VDDALLRKEIVEELEFEPSLEATHIGVAVDDGVVTLTGHVGSYAEKVAAERAASRVKGVRAIAQEIEVRYPRDKRTSDDEIAKRAQSVADRLTIGSYLLSQRVASSNRRLPLGGPRIMETSSAYNLGYCDFGLRASL
jgi:hypothetical protein